MSDTKDLCPNQADGNHRFFVFKAVEVYVPYDMTPIIFPLGQGRIQLYGKKEMVVSGCNCGASISQEIDIKA